MEEQQEINAIAQAIGFAISYWGMLETNLCSIYAAALRIPDSSAARKTFHTIISFVAKIKATDAAFRTTFSDQPALLEQWRTLKKGALRCNEKRNGLAHGAIRIVFTEPKTIGWFPFWTDDDLGALDFTDGIKLKAGKKLDCYSSSEIDTFANEFKVVMGEGRQLYQNVSEHLRVKTEQMS